MQALLRTPAFHRAVEKVAKNVHRVRHGLPREEEGGTKLEGQEENGFTKHFMDSVKGQLGAAEQAEAEKARPRNYYEQLRQGKNQAGAAIEDDESIEAMDAEAAWRRASRKLEAKKSQTKPKQQMEVVEEDADAAWRTTSQNLGQSEPSRGFMGKYMDALREQVRENKKDGR